MNTKPNARQLIMAVLNLGDAKMDTGVNLQQIAKTLRDFELKELDTAIRILTLVREHLETTADLLAGPKDAEE